MWVPIKARDCMGAALRNEWIGALRVFSFPGKASLLSSVLPRPWEGSEKACEALADLWPRWLIVCRGLEGVSLAPRICRDFNLIQMEIGRKCWDVGTRNPSRVLE